ncbi:hypothetical protein Sjap_020622 [Stephania japonica]|uniref:Thioesterase domain-containing protein n=1 Tax=Stephania japonica TaxID=461633 RepID=A0AAP0F6C7_9MAGN
MGVQNSYGSLHGGAVASIAQAVAEACARTVVAEDKEVFLGELAISYLSPARVNVALVGVKERTSITETKAMRMVNRRLMLNCGCNMSSLLDEIVETLLQRGNGSPKGLHSLVIAN